MGRDLPSLDDLYAADRTRAGVCVSVIPKPGTTYATLKAAVLGVAWEARELRWHDCRQHAGAEEGSEGWVLEATCSCMASSGDESGVVYRIEAAAPDVVEEAEVLMSAPCHIPFTVHTLEDLAFDVASGMAVGGERTAADLFRDAGLAVAPVALDAEDLARLVDAARRRMAAAEAAIARNHPNVDFGKDIFAFREMGSRGGNRFDLLFPKKKRSAKLEVMTTGRTTGRTTGDGEQEQGPGEDGGGGDSSDQGGYACTDDDDDDDDEDSAFVHDLARRAPWVRTLVDPLLSAETRGGASASDTESASSSEDEAWWCDVSIVYSRPGAGDQDWHCDGRHLAGASEAGHDGTGHAPPYAVCVFCPLVDLSPTLGFTQFWAGSHKVKGLIGFGSAAKVLRGTVDGIVPAGGCVAYDYRLMHRGMRNDSENTTRPVLQFLYAKHTYKETKNYGNASIFETRPA